MFGPVGNIIHDHLLQQLCELTTPNNIHIIAHRDWPDSIPVKQSFCQSMQELADILNNTNKRYGISKFHIQSLEGSDFGIKYGICI